MAVKLKKLMGESGLFKKNDIAYVNAEDLGRSLGTGGRQN